MTNQSILLIDDDSDLLQVIARRCEQIGLEVWQARNLLTATTILEKQVPDIICVDVNMPTGNGLQFCEMVAGDPKTAQVSIIVLTGQHDHETLQSCERLGVHHISKSPEVWKRLEPLVRSLSASKRQSANAARRIRPHKRPANSIPPCPTELTNGHAGSTSKQVVVADDDPDVVEMLSQRLSSLECSVVAADNALDAMNAIHRVLPALVCLDVNMPSGSGLSVCEMMASDARLRTIPVIVLTGVSDQSTIRRCHDLMVFYVQKGADVWSRVEPLVQELLFSDKPRQNTKPQLPTPTAASPIMSDCVAPPRGGQTDAQENLMDVVFAMLGNEDEAAQPGNDRSGDLPALPDESGPPWILIIDDDVDFSDALGVRLEEHGVAVARAFSGMAGIRMAFTSPASAILLDYNMPNGQGDYVLDRLKTNPVTKDIPVIVITGVVDKMVERRMLAMGAAAYLQKPVDFVTLRRHLAEHLDILRTPAKPMAAANSQLS